MTLASEISEKCFADNGSKDESSSAVPQPHNADEDDSTGELTASLLRRARELVSNQTQDTVFTQALHCRMRYLEWFHRFTTKQQNVLNVLTVSYSTENAMSTVDVHVVPQKDGAHRCNSHSEEQSNTNTCCVTDPEKENSSDTLAVTKPSPCTRSEADEVDDDGNVVSYSPPQPLHLIQQMCLKQNDSNASYSACGTVSATRWRHFRTWYPSEVALFLNVAQPQGGEAAPVRHRLCLNTDIYEKPRGFTAKNAAMRAQGRYCKSCLCPLRSFFALRSWAAARFCHYTGMHYCTRCHTGRTHVIPARVLHDWDFKPRPVCDEAHDFLELQRDRPVLCISAVNPALYERVPLLRMARWLRVQLMALREVGVQCRVFRRLVYRMDAVDPAEAAAQQKQTTQKQTPRVGASPRSPSRAAVESVCDADGIFGAEYFVPSERRYLVEDSEMWSLADLLDIYRCAPTLTPHSPLVAVQIQALSRAVALATSDSDVTVLLKRLRAHMVRHIMQRRCTDCMRHSRDMCRWCAPADTLTESQHQRCEVFVFDILHTRSCTHCGAVFHRQCFAEMERELGGRIGCVRCCKGCGGEEKRTNDSRCDSHFSHTKEEEFDVMDKDGQIRRLREDLRVAQLQLQLAQAQAAHYRRLLLSAQEAQELSEIEGREGEEMDFSEAGHERSVDSDTRERTVYRFVPPLEFLPSVFVAEYREVIEIIEKYAKLYHRFVNENISDEAGLQRITE